METFYKISLVVIGTLFHLPSISQIPSWTKQWDYRYGAIGMEALTAIQQTNDGGYILGGISWSDSSGDKSQHNRDPLQQSCDFWVVKVDSLGIMQWEKTFGGSGQDDLESLQQTADGGYILGGGSASGISGDKSQPNWAGSTDYWIIKIDALGNKQWDKDFGGTAEEFFWSVQQTSDGGYILGGHSSSGIGGDKSQASWGYTDYWLVKTDSLGNKQWDKTYGGTIWEFLKSVRQTADGGYIMGGRSSSSVSGDKTQPCWGGTDFWMVKTDALGNKQWDKDFGGSNDEFEGFLLQSADGGYIIGGRSYSGISGDKTLNLWGGPGDNDFWFVKTDSLGNKQWDKNFGALLHEDEFGNIFQTNDGGFLIAGTSYSQAGGDKSENNLGQEQTWVIKTDTPGNKQWDKTIFTTGHDESGFAIQTPDGCYVLANHTSATPGGYKTQPAWGLDDYWIVKFCDSAATTSVNNFQSSPSSAGINLQLFPNPTTGTILLMLSSLSKVSNFGTVHLEITNVMGEKVFKSEILNPESQINLDVSFLAKGIYIVRIGDGKSFENKKLVIE